MVEIVAGHLRSLGGTHCQTQESWFVARDAGSDRGSVVGQGQLAMR